ncbi:MAG: S-methyl-5-thioribose-1-phosphate isomerase [Dehalococcoidia bacterium]|nr:S-methyl-5-thioribose-1-phosphate isomerase [Dehalococcoidia bacterium]
MTEVQAIEWTGRKLRLLDQTKLPVETAVFEAGQYRDVVRAVKDMRVRGAPALGVVAAYGVAMAARDIPRDERSSFLTRLEEAGREIESARPTAVNMTWAVRRLLDLAEAESDVSAVPGRLLDEARAMQEEDEEVNRRIGGFGSEIVPDGGGVLTHCNTGALATAGYGTALGVIRAGWEKGKRFQVFHTETRPFLQGARLTAWELVQLGIPSTLIVDSSAGVLLNQGEVSCVVVGADRIAANGDVANKVGTYTLAVLSKENGVPFYVAAPTSTVDLSLPSGAEIPIEERRAEEVTSFGGVRTAPEGIGVRNPSFDVTPHRYVGGIITEVGILKEPYTESLARAVTGPRGDER